MTVEFVVSELIPVSAEELYHAWMDSEAHSLMTGGKAVVSAEIGGEFQAWDGYIQGKNLELDAPRRIVQNWRTQDFEESDPDSTLEIVFLTQGGNTLVAITHTGLPADGMKYQQGWIDSYFRPMQDYYSRLGLNSD